MFMMMAMGEHGLGVATNAQLGLVLWTQCAMNNAVNQ